MTYNDLVRKVAEHSGVNSEYVRKVLYHLPSVLMELAIGHAVRTPLGTFRMTQRKARPILLPDGKTQSTVPAKTCVKLNPGLRLQIEEAD